jgi:outer membrane protein assembly factor BamB
MRWIHTGRRLLPLLCCFILLVLPAQLFPVLHAGAQPVQAATSSDWPMYLYGDKRDGWNPNETIITPASVVNLHEDWHFSTNGSISTQPVEYHGQVFFGSWDGNEYATDLNGNLLWSQFLGQSNDPSCPLKSVGVGSTGAIATVSINGTLTEVLFVGGGNARLYALNAHTGAILWQTTLGTSPTPETFLWSSPAYYNGSVYMGVSSLDDCPLVQGQLVQLNASTGAVEHTFNTVPDGCIGASVWGSPAIDKTDGVLFFGTGNGGKGCSQTEQYAVSVIELSLTDLSLVSYWTVPASEQITDSDFGSSATLFQATINSVLTPLVGLVNKNGTFYAFKRADLSAGPLWSDMIGLGGQCPQCGNGDISPAAWNGYRLYIAGGYTMINGKFCRGSLRAVDPATGNYIWQDCLSAGHVLAAVSGVPGVVFVTAGTSVLAISSATGAILKTLVDMGSNSLYYGAASIANGVVYAGNMDDILHAYGT